MRKNLPKTTLLALFILCLNTTVAIKNNKTLANASPSTLMVPSDDFKSIQEAINNANSGDVIYVRSGIYYENIIINKSITLLGENRGNTIIDGGGKGDVISIQTSNVNISGFTIRNSDPFTGRGIYVERAGNIVINNNNIANNNIGIQLFRASGNTICRNVITNNLDGIDIIYYSFHNVIYENLLSGNYWGVYIAWNSDNNILYHNNFINNYCNVYAVQTYNAWSRNGEGNYWDDYSGKDLNKD